MLVSQRHAAWAFSTSWMILVEIQSTLFFAVLHWSWLRNEAAHRFHLDTLERERVSSLNVQLKGPHYPTFFKSSFPPFACLGQAMEFSPVGSGSACRGSSPGDNSAERLDSRGLSSAWPSMPVCNRCVMLPLWAFQMFSSWCFHILLYKRMQVWAYEKVLWGLHRAFFGRLSATVCSLAPLGVWNRIALQVSWYNPHYQPHARWVFNHVILGSMLLWQDAGQGRCWHALALRNESIKHCTIPHCSMPK